MKFLLNLFVAIIKLGGAHSHDSQHYNIYKFT